MESKTSSLAKRILFWCLGAPSVFLGTMYVSMVPLLLLSPPDTRSPLANLVVAPYGALMFLAALNMTLCCWRGVRGFPASDAFKPFPKVVWLSSIAAGLAAGAIAYLTAQ